MRARRHARDVVADDGRAWACESCSLLSVTAPPWRQTSDAAASLLHTLMEGRPSLVAVADDAWRRGALIVRGGGVRLSPRVPVIQHAGTQVSHHTYGPASFWDGVAPPLCAAMLAWGPAERVHAWATAARGTRWARCVASRHRVCRTV